VADPSKANGGPVPVVETYQGTTAKERIRRGMTSEEAVETPVAETYKHRKYRNGNGRKQIASSDEKE
jgi:hypothetical protein